METPCKLSKNANEYEKAYEVILNTMIRGMTAARLANSISYDFMVQMIPHHRAAIEMSQNILKYTTFVPVQEIAEEIIAEQTKSIADMQRIFGVCGAFENDPREIHVWQEQNQKIFSLMFRGMKQACISNQLNIVFMRQMLPHHRGAVEMAGNTLRCRICPELVPVLNSIIRSQKRGICRMQELLWSMGC